MPKGSRKKPLDEASVALFLKDIGAVDKENAVTYLPIAREFEVNPQDSTKVKKLKKVCRVARDSGIISIFVKENISHLYAMKR